MYLYRCERAGCSWLRSSSNANRVPHETKQASKATNPTCPHCGVVMKGPTLPLPPRPTVFNFDAAFAKVTARLQAVNAMSTRQYCTAVMNHLRTDAVALKDTFVDDMKKDAYVDIFVNASRANDPQKRCVDDALNRAGAVKAAGHPTGEKFDWEIPYIMSVARWTQVSPGAGPYWMSMVDFLRQCERGVQYLLATRPQGSADGHAILVTNANGTLWISDVQQQAYNYDKCVCIAWKRPATADRAGHDVPLPKRQVTTAGKFDGAWVTR